MRECVCCLKCRGAAERVPEIDRAASRSRSLADQVAVAAWVLLFDQVSC